MQHATRAAGHTVQVILSEAHTSAGVGSVDGAAVGIKVGVEVTANDGGLVMRVHVCCRFGIAMRKFTVYGLALSLLLLLLFG